MKNAWNVYMHIVNANNSVQKSHGILSNLKEKNWKTYKLKRKTFNKEYIQYTHTHTCTLHPSTFLYGVGVIVMFLFLYVYIKCYL